MKPLSKKTIRTALLLCVAGLLILLVSFIAVGFDVKKLETVAYETNTYEITDYFTDITVKTQTADLCFVPWEEEYCKVVCYEEEKVKHTVTVQKNTLVIDVTDTREWYDHIGMSFEDAELTVYLPKKQYDALEIEGDTGDVELPEGFTFEKGKVKTDTGDVIGTLLSGKQFQTDTDTGKVTVPATNGYPCVIITDTGDINIEVVGNR